ncbi:hypothetical protein BT96DRAFT_1105945 [Gymnopus androsaceus JB14]|uniref:Uncharacterized protein n=1 Tax=Gymnopus androsaceus JB14 TaxID=1447944 RepID=A0A6A4HKK6_9AGAR|nr:hypothetical protein BT96DRAFT_1105945 [Gymnopus androsaceus JB14]
MAALSMAMTDYWISFATSLDPSDGKGASRKRKPCYNESRLYLSALITSLNITIPGPHTTNDYRKEQIDFINSLPLTFHH